VPKSKSGKAAIVLAEAIERHIYLIRGHKVMLDADLAQLYGVTTGALNQAVKRNRSRFPEDFMFPLSRPEFENWRSHFVISNPEAKMGLRRRPYAFTEQGVAMLSSVLRSERAVMVNVAIMRAFVRLRQLLATHKDLARKFAALERKYDRRFGVIFQAIKQLMEPPGRPTRRIGFATPSQKETHSTRDAPNALTLAGNLKPIARRPGALKRFLGSRD